MKPSFAIARMIILISMILISNSAIYAQTDNSDFIITKINLNVRSCPSTNCQVLTVLAPQTKLNVIERKGEWLKINQSGNIGWIHSKYVEFIGSSEPSSTVTNHFSFDNILKITTAVITILLFFILHYIRTMRRVRISYHQHIFMLVIFIIIPVITISSTLIGEDKFFNFSLLKLITTIFTIIAILGFISLIALIAKTQKPSYIMALILIMGLAIFSSQQGQLGSFIMDLLAATIGFDSILIQAAARMPL